MLDPEPFAVDEDPWAPEPKLRFRRQRKIAQHGQGEIWEVLLVGTNRKYALKQLVLNPSEPDSTEAIRRFEREVRIQSTLSHPGIMDVVAVNFAASPPWFVMPLAQYSLADRMASNEGVGTEDDIVQLVIHLAETLDFAHREGVVHRDVKPENVLYMGDRWVVADFGLCRDFNSASTTFTMAGTAYGTFFFMAPEQFVAAHEVTPAADIFALGRVLYLCLTRESPMPATKLELLPDRFKFIVSKCLDDDPTQRYVSMAALVDDLRALSVDNADLALPIEHARKLAERVAANEGGAVESLLKFVLGHLSDEVFLRAFLPGVTPPVLASLQALNGGAFNQIVKAFDEACSGRQAFSWTDGAARLLHSVFLISSDPAIREMVLQRILVLGTEHNRWAVRDLYVEIIGELNTPAEILMVARQLSAYPEGAAFIRPATEWRSLPSAIERALAAA